MCGHLDCDGDLYLIFAIVMHSIEHWPPLGALFFFYIGRWHKSEAKKDGVDVEISKYDGKAL